MLTALDLLRVHLVKAAARAEKNDYFTQEFLRWFGRSKVVDRNGFPLPVYRAEHGNHVGHSKGGLVHYAASLAAAQFHCGNKYDSDARDMHALASSNELLEFAQQIAGLRISQTGRAYLDKKESTLDANSIAFVYLKMLRPLNIDAVQSFYVNGSNVMIHHPNDGINYEQYKGGDVPKKPYFILRETIGGSLEFAALLKNSGYDGIVFRNANSFGKAVYGVLPGNNTHPVYKAHKPGIKFKVTPSAAKYFDKTSDGSAEEVEEIEEIEDKDVSARVAVEADTYPFKLAHEYGLSPYGLRHDAAIRELSNIDRGLDLRQRVIGLWCDEEGLVIDALVERTYENDEDVFRIGYMYFAKHVRVTYDNVDDVIEVLKKFSREALARAAKGIHWQPYEQEARKLTYRKIA